MHKSSKSGIYYFPKKYEATGSIESKRERGTKPKTSTREDSMLVRLTQKRERYIVKRNPGRLEIECVSSNSLAYIQKLRVDKLYPRKKTIHLDTSQNKTWQCAWPLQKSIFRRFYNSGRVFYGHMKSNMTFLDIKLQYFLFVYFVYEKVKNDEEFVTIR
ncbi:hypothetical protein AVEN_213710-1 [Araneus ventricosus]|uniref:Uncharacterized protein n=1 Tax=Araneus ventricosus TaxID=182803 RepID=A0A4Y1ZRN1_ARAVE|nr:hypothetical protein AVEN_213710-1 [Araneus ventricosus]